MLFCNNLFSNSFAFFHCGNSHPRFFLSLAHQWLQTSALPDFRILLSMFLSFYNQNRFPLLLGSLPVSLKDFLYVHNFLLSTHHLYYLHQWFCTFWPILVNKFSSAFWHAEPLLFLYILQSLIKILSFVWRDLMTGGVRLKKLMLTKTVSTVQSLRLFFLKTEIKTSQMLWILFLFK